MSAKASNNKKVVRKSLKISVVVAEGIDILNAKDETFIDLNVYEDMKLNAVHQAVFKILQLKEEDKVTFATDSMKAPLDCEKTFKELGIANGERMYVESGRKKRKASYVSNGRPGRRDGSSSDFIGGDHTGSASSGSEEVLELVCTTRIFDNDSTLSSPIRRVRVLVCADQLCRDLIHDVSALWGRSGLKFKCGRTVLQGNKTFEELGVENNAEIVVTGGRG